MKLIRYTIQHAIVGESVVYANSPGEAIDLLREGKAIIFHADPGEEGNVCPIYPITITARETIDPCCVNLPPGWEHYPECPNFKGEGEGKK